MEQKKNKINYYTEYKEEKMSAKLVFVISILNFLDEIADKIDIKNDKENKSKDPIMSLINKFEEIQSIKKIIEENICKFYYFNRKTIHKILYEHEENINIGIIIKKNLSFYFYLNLLIKENLAMTDYTYSFDLIEELNDSQESNNNEIYKKIILSKVIIELIDYYKNIDIDNHKEEKKEKEEKLKEIENKNKLIIKQNINYIEQIGLDEKKYLKTNIDEIYIKIINFLIDSNKFENYTDAYNIIHELDLENIIITNRMIEKLSEILNNNENYINNYIIKDIKDLFIEKKINFYHILFKYILKNSIYIYEIPKLLEIKANIFKEIHSKKIIQTEKITHFNILENIKDKLYYIIEKITDSKYYLNIILDYHIDKGESYLFPEIQKLELNSKVTKEKDSDDENIKILIQKIIMMKVI